MTTHPDRAVSPHIPADRLTTVTGSGGGLYRLTCRQHGAVEEGTITFISLARTRHLAEHLADLATEMRDAAR